MNNFILEFDNFLNDGQCDYFISFFNKMEKMNLTGHREYPEYLVSDAAASTCDPTFIENDYIMINHSPLIAEFVRKFWNHANAEYVKKYSAIINSPERYDFRIIKFQKTIPGQGYHTFHYESSSRQDANRLLTFIMYLNDVEAGGETEFLYYPIRIPPKKGKLILFPGAFTHAHRGNQPLSGEKYILTGWLTF